MNFVSLSMRIAYDCVGLTIILSLLPESRRKLLHPIEDFVGSRAPSQTDVTYGLSGCA
jgi:hypothetical protein